MSMRPATGSALISAALILCASCLFAQNQPAQPYVRYPPPPKAQAGIKSLVGEVVNAQGAKLSEAVVHLRDKKTLEVQTRITDAQGKYVFRGLDRDADYEVHAEYKSASSPSKSISHFDDRDEINLTLEIPSK